MTYPLGTAIINKKTDHYPLNTRKDAKNRNFHYILCKFFGLRAAPALDALQKTPAFCVNLSNLVIACPSVGQGIFLVGCWILVGSKVPTYPPMGG
jgi:hypothetical protein